MRTTVRLDERLMKDVKRFAHETGRTLTAFIEESLREALARRRAPQARERVRLPVFGGDGLQPGVDLDDSAALLDRMDGRRGPS
jgi:hypothetical protein